ncbi:(S)-benzoin forming benzil reductase [Oceanobacillus jeddahense]|uniref:(S)-benzoin forming benzil reductase n=1 Tax=Oceanobacillus jeddahense TaxID=1462527 RepID=UPI001FCC878C|nr:(S)-benzoin forming benzil reductase [Oceanobacillus jeddahense]
MKQMRYFIVTGTSKGIGASLAKQLLDIENSHVICISRQPNQELIDTSENKSSRLSYYSFDLSRTNEMDQLFEQIFETIDSVPNIESISLINNAGVLNPIGPIEANETEDIINNVAINLLAPMACVSNFIKHTNTYNIDKRVMNISSGSAKYLLPSQSCYSTSKAGLDSFSKSVSLEQLHKSYPVKVVSVYPGVIDTQMQSEIRSTRKEDFPYVDQFRQLAEQGKLQTAEYTAEKLIQLLCSDDFGRTTVVEDLFSIS